MKTVLSRLLLVAAMFAPAFANAEVPKHGFSPEQNAVMAQSNSKMAANIFINGLFQDLSTQKADTAATVIPWAEYSEVGYVIFSEDFEFNSGAAKKTIAQNLPEGVTLVVFTGNNSETHQRSLFKKFAGYIAPERLKVVFLPGGGKGFWARDGIPVPVWKPTAAGSLEFNVVDAKYYHNFEADDLVSEFFNAPLIQHSYYYEGGNYAANSKGDCIVVDNDRVQKMPDSIFKSAYGCHKSLTRLPFTKGIGHVDESVKFMDDDTLVVDDAEYAKTLKAKGWEVIKMARPARDFETYVNTLVVNGTAFMPAFSEKTDADAIKLYESFGLKVIPLDSRSLSNDGMGSIHCITMAYPPVPFNELLQHIGAKDIK